MNRRAWSAATLLVMIIVPAAANADTVDETAPSTSIWGGEIRLHAGGLTTDEGLGRTGGPFESRFSLDAPLTQRLRFYGEVGSGRDQGADEPGLHQMYLSFQPAPSRDISLKAGWIRMPFGRWDAFTLSRPLIKDREFTVGSTQTLFLRRASAGLSFHAGSGLFEVDAAFLDQNSSQDVRIEPAGAGDAVERFGIRRGGLSAGVSLLQGYRGDSEIPPGSPPDRGAVLSQGVDLQWSRGPVSLGGEAVVIDIAGKSNSGYYLEGSWDISFLVRGMRLLSKFDVLNQFSGGPEGRFQRSTLGLRQSLRRDLDLEVEVDRDHGSRPLPGFGGSHLVFGLRYRF